MKIVILDIFTANPGDLPMDGLNELGEVVVYDRTAPEELLERAQGAEVLLTNKVMIGADAIRQLPQLKYIGVMATGYNVVDLAAATEHGIVVTNIPAYSTMSVAQTVFAHLLTVTNNVAGHAQAVKDGRWQNCADFNFCLSPLQELDGKTFAILGLGNIGMAVARIAQSFGMNVLAYSSKDEAALLQLGIRKAKDVEELFGEADVLSLHCPLTENTHHIVNARTLSLMKSSAILINTGRGPLIDEGALAQALQKGEIAAACVDVLEQEPPRNGSPLIDAPNCYITPHIAWASKAARARLMSVLLENLKSFINGNVQNQVNR